LPACLISIESYWEKAKKVVEEIINLSHASSAVLGLAINMICQILAQRFICKQRLLRSVIVGFVVGLCFLGVSEVFFMYRHSLVLKENLGSIITNVIAYTAFGYGYFHFINMGETARRIRILRELYASKKGLTQAEILSRYSYVEIINRRIERLVNKKQIISDQGKYYINKPLMLLIAKIIVITKQIVFGKKSEFD
jgi:hypothetical protein